MSVEAFRRRYADSMARVEAEMSSGRPRADSGRGAVDAQAWFFLEALGRSAVGADDFAEIADAALALLATSPPRDPAVATIALRTVRLCVLGLRAAGERGRAGRLAHGAGAVLPDDDAMTAQSSRWLRYLSLDLAYDDSAGAETLLPLAAEATAGLRRDGHLTGEVANVAASPCWRLARRLARLGHEDAASELIETACAAMPERAELHAHHGNIVLAFDRVAAAEAAYRRSIALDAGMGWVHRQLSICLERRGRLDEALAAARRAVELDPGEPVSRAHLDRLAAAGR